MIITLKRSQNHSKNSEITKTLYIVKIALSTPKYTRFTMQNQ